MDNSAVFSSDTVAVPTKSVMRGERITTFDPREYANQSPKVMLMNAWQERLELHDLVLRVQRTCKDMKVDRLLIEDKDRQSTRLNSSHVKRSRMPSSA